MRHVAKINVAPSVYST